LIFFDVLFLFDCAIQQAWFAVQCPAAAAAAGQVDDTILFIFWVGRKSAGALMKGFFVQVPRTTLLDDVALDKDQVFFLI
jgi:hypothetical protein